MPARHQQNTEYIHINIRCQFYISIKTGEWEISNINCAQTQPADLTHILDLILLRRLLQKQALGKEAHLHQRTFFAKKRSFTCIYCVFLAFLCLLFFLCLQILGRNNKSVHNMSSVVESSTALASFPSGSSVLESCLAGALGRPCIFLMPV